MDGVDQFGEGFSEVGFSSRDLDRCDVSEEAPVLAEEVFDLVQGHFSFIRGRCFPDSAGLAFAVASVCDGEVGDGGGARWLHA